MNNIINVRDFKFIIYDQGRGQMLRRKRSLWYEIRRSPVVSLQVKIQIVKIIKILNDNPSQPILW